MIAWIERKLSRNRGVQTRKVDVQGAHIPPHWDERDKSNLRELTIVVNEFLSSNKDYSDNVTLDAHYEPLRRIERDYTGTPRAAYLEALRTELAPRPFYKGTDALRYDEFNHLQGSNWTVYSTSEPGVYLTEDRKWHYYMGGTQSDVFLEIKLVRRDLSYLKTSNP